MSVNVSPVSYCDTDSDDLLYVRIGLTYICAQVLELRPINLYKSKIGLSTGHFIKIFDTTIEPFGFTTFEWILCRTSSAWASIKKKKKKFDR